MSETEKPATFEEYLQKQGLGVNTVKLYARMGRKIKAEFSDNPSTFLTVKLNGAKVGTVSSYTAAARHYATWKGVQLIEPNIRPMPNATRESLSPEELAAYYAAIDRLPVAEPVRTMLFLFPKTGLRCSEMCSLERKNIQQMGGQWGVMLSGKGEKYRFVPLSPSAYRILYTWLTKAPKSTFIFPSPQNPNYSITAGTVQATIRLLRQILPGYAGELTTHVLRHTFATNLIATGVDINTVRDLLGHEELETTQTYLHPSASMKMDAVSRLDET